MAHKTSVILVYLPGIGCAWYHCGEYMYIQLLGYWNGNTKIQHHPLADSSRLQGRLSLSFCRHINTWNLSCVFKYRMQNNPGISDSAVCQDDMHDVETGPPARNRTSPLQRPKQVKGGAKGVPHGDSAKVYRQ